MIYLYSQEHLQINAKLLYTFNLLLISYIKYKKQNSRIRFIFEYYNTKFKNFKLYQNYL